VAEYIYQAAEEVSIQVCLCVAFVCVAPRDCLRAGLGAGGNWRHPGISGEGVAQSGEDAGAVLGGGGDVAADGVPVPGGVFGAEPAGDLLLGLGRADVPFSLVRGGGNTQVRGEPEHVILAVVQAFQQQPGGRLLRLGGGKPAHGGQAGQDSVPEQLQVRGGVSVRDGGQALLAGQVGGVDHGLQRLSSLDGPDRAWVSLGSVSKITQ